MSMKFLTMFCYSHNVGGQPNHLQNDSLQQLLGADIETLSRAQGTTQKSGKMPVGDRWVEDIRRIQCRKSCKQGSQGLTEIEEVFREPACISNRSSAYMMWLFIFVFNKSLNDGCTGDCPLYLPIGASSSYWIDLSNLDIRVYAQLFASCYAFFK